jgi:hypothetical protein
MRSANRHELTERKTGTSPVRPHRETERMNKHDVSDAGTHHKKISDTKIGSSGNLIIVPEPLTRNAVTESQKQGAGPTEGQARGYECKNPNSR